MQTSIDATHEETIGDVATTALVCLDGLPPPDLDGLDYRILAAWSEHKAWGVLAAELAISPVTIKNRVRRPVFQQTLQRLQRNFFDQVARGEYGALALLKANTVGAVKRLIGMSRGAEDERVKLNAILEVIKLAGVQPPKPAVIENPERLLDQMTAEELDHFDRTNEFPRRLADQLARVAATVLQGRERAPVVEVEAVDDMAPAPSTLAVEEPAVELPDEDGPLWAPLPDETELDEGGIPPREPKVVRPQGRPRKKQAA